MPNKWSDELAEADTVLAVDEVAKAALNLGYVGDDRADSTGALHDVFLSRPEAAGGRPMGGSSAGRAPISERVSFGASCSRPIRVELF